MPENFESSGQRGDRIIGSIHVRHGFRGVLMSVDDAGRLVLAAGVVLQEMRDRDVEADRSGVIWSRNEI